MIGYKKVSVITVARNCAPFLATAFKSFAYQDYQNMEWLIVNDASTDSTSRLLQKYRRKDSRVKLCLNKTEKGYADSYAFAISKAQGDYIAFLEPENVWVKDKITRQVGFMERYDAALSHSSYAFVDHFCDLLPVGCCHIEPKVSLINFGKDADICLSAFMMNREEIKDLFPLPETDEIPDILMYLMQKGMVSQGITEVLTLCRLHFDYPTRQKELESVKEMYTRLHQENIPVPNLMRYQAYKATNVVRIKLEPSVCIDRSVAASMDELKNFKL